MNRSRRVIVLVMLAVLAVTLTAALWTRGVMEYLPFLKPGMGVGRELMSASVRFNAYLYGLPRAASANGIRVYASRRTRKNQSAS